MYRGWYGVWCAILTLRELIGTGVVELVFRVTIYVVEVSFHFSLRVCGGGVSCSPPDFFFALTQEEDARNVSTIWAILFIFRFFIVLVREWESGG